MCKLIYKFKAVSQQTASCLPPTRPILFTSLPPRSQSLAPLPLPVVSLAPAFPIPKNRVDCFRRFMFDEYEQYQHIISSHRLNQYTTKQKMANVYKFYEQQDVRVRQQSSVCFSETTHHTHVSVQCASIYLFVI